MSEIIETATVEAEVETEIQFEALEAPVTTVTSDGADLGRVIDVPVELGVTDGTHPLRRGVLHDQVASHARRASG